MKAPSMMIPLTRGPHLSKTTCRHTPQGPRMYEGGNSEESRRELFIFILTSQVSLKY